MFHLRFRGLALATFVIMAVLAISLSACTGSEFTQEVTGSSLFPSTYAQESIETDPVGEDTITDSELDSETDSTEEATVEPSEEVSSDPSDDDPSDDDPSDDDPSDDDPSDDDPSDDDPSDDDPSDDDPSDDDPSGDELTEEKPIALSFNLHEDENAYYFAGFKAHESWNGNLHIPSEHEGLPVIGIEPEACKEQTSIVNIFLPGKVRYIGYEAFSGCTSLIQVDFSFFEGQIDEGAFSECTSLQAAYFPQEIESIGMLAFWGCTSLEELYIHSIVQLGGASFENCTGLTLVQLLNVPKTAFAGQVFAGCTSIEYAVLPFWMFTEDENVATHVSILFADSANLSDVYFREIDEQYRFHAHPLTYTEGVVPTCTESGISNAWYCEKCETLYLDKDGRVLCAEDELLLPATGHTEYIFEGYAPTCTEDGLTDGIVCPDCDKVMQEQEVIPAVGHRPVLDKARPATCTEDGLTEGSHCTVCNQILTTQKTVPATGHREAPVDRVEPTCTKDGMEGGTRCSTCHQILTEGTILPATGHTEVIDPRVEPTCGTTGLTEGKHCSACGKIFIEQEYLPVMKDAHSYNEEDICSICDADKPGVTYELSREGTYAIVTGTNIQMKDVVIRAYYRDRPVTKIQYGAFEYSAICSVTIPDSVTEIEGRAFAYCRHLEMVHFGTGIKTIGESAFGACEALTSIQLPDGVSIINKGTFSNCTALSSIQLPGSITTIEKWAFNRCYALTHITLPDGLSTIAEEAFTECTALESVVFPVGLISLHKNAFLYCDQFVEIIDQVQYAGEWLLSCDTSHNKPVTVRDGTKGLADYAFENCYRVNNVYLPEGLRVIGVRALSCGLGSITLPNSVQHIGNSAFSETGITSIVIPEGITRIGYMMFYMCTNLESVSLPSTVTSIEGYAFGACTALKSIILPEGLTEIGESAFGNCKTLTEIHIPAQVTSIADEAFRNCLGLKSVTGCKGLTSIGRQVFYKCTALESVSMPTYMTYLGEQAFYECGSLKNIVIPEGVIEIGDQTFYKCSNLVEVTIPSTVKSIGAYAFDTCYLLSTLVLPEVLETIGEGAFCRCQGLSHITFGDTLSAWEAMSKGKYWGANMPECTVSCVDGEIILNSNT